MSKIAIQGVHYHISENTMEFIKEKLGKLSYLQDRITDGKLRVIHEKKEYKAEIDIHFNHGARIHLRTTHEQLYPAVENLMHKLKQHAAEEKEKIKDYHNHHNPHRHINDESLTGAS